MSLHEMLIHYLSSHCLTTHEHQQPTTPRTTTTTTTTNNHNNPTTIQQINNHQNSLKAYPDRTSAAHIHYVGVSSPSIPDPHDIFQI